ncbi:hypothetical protein [Saccharothrix syringae]|uniref:hypothetical protein n=1 Tax=Saccharothrix syringae TaxID=103733 RepID=UPI000A5330C6|nr:hypothetical protein [Saccharothrix syringae]
MLAGFVLAGVGMAGTGLLVTQYLQGALGFSPVASAVLFAPMGLGVAVGTAVAPAPAGRVGRTAAIAGARGRPRRPAAGGIRHRRPGPGHRSAVRAEHRTGRRRRAPATRRFGGGDVGDRQPPRRHVRLAGRGAELVRIAREAFTAGLHVTGVLAAVVFAGVAVLVLLTRARVPSGSTAGSLDRANL